MTTNDNKERVYGREDDYVLKDEEQLDLNKNLIITMRNNDMYKLKINKIEELLQKGAKVNFQSLDGEASLHIAAKMGYGQIIEVLLAANADVNLKTSVEYNVNLFCTSLYTKDTFRENNKALPEMDTNIRTKLTALHLAVKNGHLNVVKLLLDNNANVNSNIEDKLTPLHVSIQMGNIEITEYLVDKGADVNIETIKQYTPLHLASELGHYEIVNFLLSKKVDVINVKTDDGSTPLHLAAKNGFLNTVKILIENNASILANDCKGRTPFELAAKNNHLNVYEYIVNSIKMPVEEIKVNKRPGTSSVSGQHYEFSLLMLLSLEGTLRNNINNFYLATNMTEAGDFDDANFKFNFKTKDGKIETEILFIQARHKATPEKEIITFEKLFSENDKDFFTLKKYFNLYRQIKKYFKQSNTEHPIFAENFEKSKFIFFTNAIFDFSNNERFAKEKEMDSDNILYMGENYNNKYFQVNFYENSEQIVRDLEHSSDCKKLARTIVESLFSPKGIDVDKGIIKEYHASLASDVIEKKKIGEGLLMSSFLSDDNDTQLKQTFLDEIQKHKDFAGMSKEELKLELSSKIFKIPKNFGIVKDKHLKLILPTDLVTEDEMKDFLSKLMIFSSKPNEGQMREIIKEKLQSYFSLERDDAESIFSEVKEKIETWWKNNNNFITEENDIYQSFILNDSVRNFISFEIQDMVEIFTGREQELKILHELFQKHKIVVISQISHDFINGIGKTELARKYIHENSQKYDNNLIWVDASNENTLIESFHRLAHDKMRISTINKQIRSIICDILNFFQNKKCLFIFDNAEQENYFHDVLSLFAQNLTENDLHILITSRDNDWRNSIEVLKIKPLSPDDAVKFVKKGLSSEEESPHDDVEKLVKMVDCHPWFIKQAIDYIENQRITGEYKIRDYISDFKYLQTF